MVSIVAAVVAASVLGGLTAFACCKAAGDADRAAERLWREGPGRRGGPGACDERMPPGTDNGTDAIGPGEPDRPWQNEI